MAKNAAFCDITFASAASAAGVWKDCDYVNATQGASVIPTVEMDGAPGFVFITETQNDGVHTGIKSVQPGSVTKNGLTILSTHLQDSSRVRVYAFFTPTPLVTRGAGY